MDNFLFLTGVGRSGTTVLRTSLGLHPDIYYNGKENNIVQDVLEVAYRNCSQPSRKFSMVVQQEEYNRIFCQAIQSLLWPVPQVNPKLCKMAAINVEEDQLNYLSEVFPSSKILCLVRNGIEVVSSRVRYESFAGQSFEKHCAVWNRSQGVVSWGERNPKAFRLIRHEWFYQPKIFQQELSSLYQWIGIADSPLPLESITNTLTHPTAGDEVIGPDVFPQLSESEKTKYFLSKRKRWSDWSSSQREYFETHCGELMQTLGYAIPWRDQ